VAVVLLRKEYVTRGIPTAADPVLVEIVDEVYVPLVRGAARPPASDARRRSAAASLARARKVLP
jgi:hypothetical protein